MQLKQLRWQLLNNGDCIAIADGKQFAVLRYSGDKGKPPKRVAWKIPPEFHSALSEVSRLIQGKTIIEYYFYRKQAREHEQILKGKGLSTARVE